VVDLLRVLLKATAGRHGVAPKLIATSDELEEIARSDETDVPVLRGWRKKLFGDDALALKRGQLALAIRKGEVAVIAPEALAADKPKDERQQ
jgi:ribonuclease D